MPVTQKLMAAGGWSLRLVRDTPWRLTDALRPIVGGYGHILVLPVQYAAWQLSSSRAFNLAIYSGVLRSVTDRVELAGPGPAVWLADESGEGDTEWPWTHTTSTLAGALGNLMSVYSTSIGTPPFRSSSAASSISLAVGISMTQGTLREKLDHLCRAFGVEWDIDGGLNLRVGYPLDLWPSPAGVLISPLASGWDPEWHGIRATVKVRQHLDQWAHAIGVRNTGSASYSIGLQPWRDVNGNNVRRTAVITMSETQNVSLPAVALGIRVQRNTVGQDIDVESDDYCAVTRAPVGSLVNVWDPDAGIENAISYRTWYQGSVIAPLQTRLVECTWPIRAGMAVYFRPPTSTSELIDLTPYVDWEEGNARLVLGQQNPISLTEATSGGHRNL